jgi:hypothetical protein
MKKTFLVFLLTMLNSCSDSSSTEANPQVNIGDSYQGGIIAYIFMPDDNGYIAGQTHGIIAATSDQGNASNWGSFDLVGCSATNLGSGLNNTNQIASVNTYGAGEICFNLTLNNYNDWYLPSMDELDKLLLNQAYIDGFVAGSYWSSSEGTRTPVTSTEEYAGTIDFPTGNRFYVIKDTPCRVRAIRTF